MGHTMPTPNDHDTADRAREQIAAERDAFVDELCRHFPGLAPAIRAVAYRVIEESVDERGTCCTGEPA